MVVVRRLAGDAFALASAAGRAQFRLDFAKLLDLFGSELKARIPDLRGSADAPAAGSLYFYTALFEIPEEADPEWPDISGIRANVESRRRFADDAVAAGFFDEGIFRVPLRTWIIERLRERRYQEKMVDTSLVARLVEQAVADPRRLHVLVSGDLDMLPAIRTVVPHYTETVVLATTHPEQYIRGEAQSSYRLNQFGFRLDPIYLEQSTERIVQGQNVYRCSNPRCNRIFARPRPIPRGRNPICKPCADARI